MAEAMQRVRVSFRKQVSDGNYGTEAAEASIELDVDETEDDTILEILLKQVRQRVHAELGRSPSSAVRRAVEDKPNQQLVQAGVAEDMPF